MPVKIFVSNADKQSVARRLLEAADDPQHVRVEKTRGYGYVITDELAEKLGLTPDKNVARLDEGSSENADPKQTHEPTAGEKNSEASSENTEKPKRGRPRGGAKSKENSDGE